VIHAEDLVEEPERAAAEICEFLNVSYRGVTHSDDEWLARRREVVVAMLRNSPGRTLPPRVERLVQSIGYPSRENESVE